jgi:histidinol-phosphatase (PHP family)
MWNGGYIMNDEDHLHNFHSHTLRCKHALGEVKEYCQVAVDRGMKTLGISDHMPWPDDRWNASRMDYAELEDYSKEIDQAKIDFPEIKILKGMECEYDAEYRAWFDDELLGKYQFEYLVGGVHMFLDGDRWCNTYKHVKTAARLKLFADATVEMMETGLFDFIAHPDLFGVDYTDWDADAIACSRDILSAAVDLDIGLEINALGLRKQGKQELGDPLPLYPWRPFWEEATHYDIKVIVNSDAHRPVDLQNRTGDALKIATELNLTMMDVSTIGTRVAK